VIFHTIVREEEGKQIQWRGFIRKTKLTEAPEDFKEVVDRLADFLSPIAGALEKGKSFGKEWKAPGPWL
jgi:hypothetical protein